LAGPLGAVLLRRSFDLGFLRRGKEPRAVKLTVTGAKFLALELGEIPRMGTPHEPFPGPGGNGG
jgi:hypothetical protein